MRGWRHAWLAIPVALVAMPISAVWAALQWLWRRLCDAWRWARRQGRRLLEALERGPGL